MGGGVSGGAGRQTKAESALGSDGRKNSREDGYDGGAIAIAALGTARAATMAVRAKKTHLLYVERGAGSSYLKMLVGLRHRVTQIIKNPCLILITKVNVAFHDQNETKTMFRVVVKSNINNTMVENLLNSFKESLEMLDSINFKNKSLKSYKETHLKKNLYSKHC